MYQSRIIHNLLAQKFIHNLLAQKFSHIEHSSLSRQADSIRLDCQLLPTVGLGLVLELVSDAKMALTCLQAQAVG